MIDHDYLFKRVLETIPYDYTPANIRAINSHLVHGTTPIFDINSYSKEIEYEPHHHTFDHTLVYSILENTSSETTIRTLESTPPKNINVRIHINDGYNYSITIKKTSYICTRTLYHFL